MYTSLPMARSGLWKGTKRLRCHKTLLHCDKNVQVFEDTRHLVQSAVDGYNVCIFAYGQTGSGKTHTIYGGDGSPGLTPRGIHELFNVLDRYATNVLFTRPMWSKNNL